MKLSEMKKHYPTQKDCYDLLDELVWNDVPTCPSCNSTCLARVIVNSYNTKDSYECGSCGKRYSVISKTMFHSTQLPLVKWFTAIHIIKTFRRLPEGRLLGKMIGVSTQSCIKLRAKILADLATENSLSEKIYEYNKHYE